MVLTLPACAGHHIFPTVYENSIPPEIRRDLTVSGAIRVRGEVKVFPGAVLTVQPGTRFLFEPFDPDGDGVNDSRLVIEGRLVARGEPDDPVFFSSAAEKPEPGDWLELRVDRSEGSVLEYCVLEHSRYGLHVHFSSGVVANSLFRGNIDGTRFGNSRFLFVKNRVSGNLGRGVNLRASAIVVAGNDIAGNRHGVFVFEEGRESRITDNSFSGNALSDIRLGDFYVGDPPCMRDNEGPSGVPLVVQGRDGLSEDASGDASTGTGPFVEEWRAKPLWESEVGSFVDGSPVPVDGGRIAVASWKEGITLLDERDGAVLSRTAVGDVVDATPLVHGAALLFPVWDRTFVRMDTIEGVLHRTDPWPSSPVDDHRQASPVLLEGKVVQGLWNGELRAMDPWTLETAWSLQLDGPIRATPVVEAGNVQVVTEGGTYYLVSNKGAVLVKQSLGEPVWSSPAALNDGKLAVLTKKGVLKLFLGKEVVWTRIPGGPATYAPPISLGQPPLAYVAVADGKGSVCLFDSSGALFWKAEVGSAVHTLSLAGQALWVGAEDGTLAALNMVTGRITLLLKAGGAVHGAPAWRGGWEPLFWAARDGKVRAHRIMHDTQPWEGPAR